MNSQPRKPVVGSGFDVHKYWVIGLFAAATATAPLITISVTKLSDSESTQPKKIANSLGMALVLVPPGEFRMGAIQAASNPVCPDASPAHQVRISEPFYLGEFEVTQAQYQAIMPIAFDHPVAPFFSEIGGGHTFVNELDTGRLPIDNVSTVFADEFCRRLSALPEERAAGRVYRLPTEAEWEYACRAGSTTLFAYGDTLALDQANFNSLVSSNGRKPLGRVSLVGSYPPNAFGIYDMHGNVWEWCQDSMRPYASSFQTNPRGPKTLYRVLRGGAWDMPATYCRSDYRTGALGGYVMAGFRVVCEIDRND